MIETTGERQRQGTIAAMPGARGGARTRSSSTRRTGRSTRRRDGRDRARRPAVELRYLGRGHTDNDIVVLVPDADVLFAGDLVEADATPFFGDGYPIDWPETVERLVELVTGAVVPGHGTVGDRAFAVRQMAEFREVAELARLVDAGVIGIDAAVAPDALPGRRRDGAARPGRWPSSAASSTSRGS